MSASESPGLPKSAIAPPSANAGPLRANWYGPHRAIRAVGTRASICISSGGLCNPIPGGSSAPQHFCKKCGGGSVQYDLPGGNPQRDQGTAFMSRTIRELYGLLGIKSVLTSVYHPQTDGLVERFNRTLKTMIRKFIHEDAKNWDKWLEPLLFAVREVPQASTGFSPFELLYGRQPRGVLDVLRETWEEGPSESKNEIQHVLDLRTKLHTLGQLSMENLLQAQDKQSRLYNWGTRLRKFAPGDKVLVLLPTSSSKLLAK